MNRKRDGIIGGAATSTTTGACHVEFMRCFLPRIAIRRAPCFIPCSATMKTEPAQLMQQQRPILEKSADQRARTRAVAARFAVTCHEGMRIVYCTHTIRARRSTRQVTHTHDMNIRRLCATQCGRRTMGLVRETRSRKVYCGPALACFSQSRPRAKRPATHPGHSPVFMHCRRRRGCARVGTIVCILTPRWKKGTQGG